MQLPIQLHPTKSILSQWLLLGTTIRIRLYSELVRYAACHGVVWLFWLWNILKETIQQKQQAQPTYLMKNRKLIKTQVMDSRNNQLTGSANIFTLPSARTNFIQESR